MDTLFSIKLQIRWPSQLSCLKEQIRETVTEVHASIAPLNKLVTAIIILPFPAWLKHSGENIYVCVFWNNDSW